MAPIAPRRLRDLAPARPAEPFAQPRERGLLVSAREQLGDRRPHRTGPDDPRLPNVHVTAPRGPPGRALRRFPPEAAPGPANLLTVGRRRFVRAGMAQPGKALDC